MKNILKISILLMLVFFTISHSFAQVKEQSFEEYQKQESQNYQDYAEAEAKAYQEYMKEEQEGIAKLRKEIEDFWGTGEFVSSTKKDWVEYSQDKKSRSNVDFENGTAKVEVLLSPEEAKNKALSQKKLEEAVSNLVVSKGKTKDYETKSEKPKSLSNDPVLKGQLQNSNGEKVNDANAKSFAKEVIKKKENIKTETVKGADGEKRVKMIITMPLAPDFIKVRASKYQNEINKYANKYNLPVELVYAVIHTESYFNPKAKSGAPAYGLMQLVPRSGARDAYQYVFKKDKIVAANYLYQPEKNIELGSAYLHLLMKRYFSKVEDINSRMLCAIASYNTGAGNLAKAFTGKTNPKKAIPIINSMSYEELYGYLRAKLPYDETKGYIKKVSQRMTKYRQWKKVD
jgi:membrane-bound lytic murein transglycosylase C